MYLIQAAKELLIELRLTYVGLMLEVICFSCSSMSIAVLLMLILEYRLKACYRLIKHFERKGCGFEKAQQLQLQDCDVFRQQEQQAASHGLHSRPLGVCLLWWVCGHYVGHARHGLISPTVL